MTAVTFTTMRNASQHEVVPYTPASVEMIRAGANGGRSRGELIAATGWDDGMFDRVCERHHIELVGSAEIPKTNVIDLPSPSCGPIRRGNRYSRGRAG